MPSPSGGGAEEQFQHLLAQAGILSKSMQNTGNDDSLRVQAADMQAGAHMGSSEMNVSRIPMLYLDPLFDPILIVFPQDNIRELNRRLRHYYKYDPFIRSIIDFHTETPISDFELRCPGYKEIEEYYRDFKDDINLVDVITNWCRDYWLLGEAFYYGNWDDHYQEFKSFVQIPPEEMEVHSVYMESKRLYVLRPNKEAVKMMKSRNPADQRLSQLMDVSSPMYSKALRENKPFILDSNRLLVIQRSMAGYSNRGISPVMSVVKELLFQDYLNLFRTAFIQRHSYPLRLFKIGSAEKGFIPPPRMYEEFKRLLAASTNDPNFNIVTHPFVNVEYHTGHDKILPLIPYYDLVKSRVFAGLFVSDAIITGEKTPYASGITFMKGLMNRYLTFRNNLESELKRKIFANLARKHEFYQPKPADVAHRVITRRNERRLIVPKFYWHKANLLSHQAIQQMVIDLRAKKEIPMRYVAEMFGWDFDAMLEQLKTEEGTRADSAWQKIREKAVVDGKEPSDLGRKVLLGENMEDALQEHFKDGVKSGPEQERQEEKGKGKGNFEPPKVAPKARKPEADMSRAPSEAGPKPTLAPEVGKLAESQPKPGESEGTPSPASA